MIERLDPEPELEPYPERKPQPYGQRVPPGRFPPTAVGVETPDPEPEPHPRRRFARLWEPRPSVLGDFTRLALVPLRTIHLGWKSLSRSWRGWREGWYLRGWAHR